MNILLDNIIFSKSKNGGISNYWFELSKYILNQKSDSIHFFENENTKLNFHRKQLEIPSQDIIQQKNSASILSRLLPVTFKSTEKFIYHSSYYRGISGAKNKIEVTTVYDFIHNYYAPIHKKIVHNNLKFSAIKRSKGIICISKNTYMDLQKFCPTKKNQKTEVIHVGVSDDYFPIAEFTESQKDIFINNNLTDDYIVFVGGRTNYKNFDFVATALNNTTGIKLVIVGGGILSENEIKIFSKEALTRVVFIPSASNEELNVLLNNAVALVYPSSYEGFGIPVVEAMRAGCPVIGLNNATIKEVAEKSALLLEKLEVSEFQNHLVKLKNTDFRNQTREIGFVESKKYSWDKCSKETHEFYKELY